MLVSFYLVVLGFFLINSNDVSALCLYILHLFRSFGPSPISSFLFSSFDGIRLISKQSGNANASPIAQYKSQLPRGPGIGDLVHRLFLPINFLWRWAVWISLCHRCQTFIIPRSKQAVCLKNSPGSQQPIRVTSRITAFSWKTGQNDWIQPAEPRDY